MSVQGLARLNAQLDSISRSVSDPAYVVQAATFVRSAAALLAPVHDGYLRQSINWDVDVTFGKGITGTVYTDLEYAPYVELGTGPKGAMSHEGISPNVAPVYTLEPWWIHESQLDPGIGEFYHWPHIDTDAGRFYKCSGQAAQPYLYPALADNRNTVIDILEKGIKKAMEDAT